MYVCAHVCMCVCIFIDLAVYTKNGYCDCSLCLNGIRVCMHVCMYVCMYVYTHTYTQMPPHSHQFEIRQNASETCSLSIHTHTYTYIPTYTHTHTLRCFRTAFSSKFGKPAARLVPSESNKFPYDEREEETFFYKTLICKVPNLDQPVIICIHTIPV